MTAESTLVPRRRGAGLVRVSRGRGALSGLLLLLLGLWGAIVPFVGPYWNYAYTPNATWTWTAGRLVFNELPAYAVILGALLLLASSARAVALFGAWLALVGGAWFVVGTIFSPFWSGAYSITGTPLGDRTSVALEQIGIFYGLGAVILLVAGHAAGSLAVRTVSDVRAAERYAAARTAVPVTREPVREPVVDVRDPAGEPAHEPVREQAVAREAVAEPATAGRGHRGRLHFGRT